GRGGRSRGGGRPALWQTAGGGLLPPRTARARQGQPGGNAEARRRGRAAPPLSKLGRREAVALRGVLAGFAPGRVLSSDLRRTRETAAALGHPEAAADPIWREIGVGEWAGPPLADPPARPEPSWRRGRPRP